MKPQTDELKPADNAVQKAQPLFDHLAEVTAELNAAPHIFLFVDFDGTLAPIVEEPTEAFMPARAALSLIRLTERPYVSVAVVSGRSLEDLEERVGLRNVIYAGDHGFAIRGEGLSFIERIAAERKRALSMLMSRLEPLLRTVTGARLEEKGFTASIHYRQVPEEQHEQLFNLVRDAVETSGDLFRITQGLRVLEIRPRVEWNKGTAARWIMNLSGKPNALPIYIGDDATDEDAFAALASGITIRVGPYADTLARYRLESQRMVGEFLSWLANYHRALASGGGSGE